MGPNNHIKSYFVSFQPKSWPKVENGQSEVGSNFAQHNSKWAQIIISSHMLSHFSQKVDQKWKMVKSEVGSNFVKNDSKWALIVISRDILSIFSQKVDQKWKMVKSEVGSNYVQNDSKWALIVISSEKKIFGKKNFFVKKYFFCFCGGQHLIITLILDNVGSSLANMAYQGQIWNLFKVMWHMYVMS